MNCLQVMAVRVDNREETAVQVQKVLTAYGCSIRTRLGLHDQPAGGGCSPMGLLILQLCSEEAVSRELEKRLNSIDGVKAKFADLA